MPPSQAKASPSETARLLLIEDDPDVGKGLQDYFLGRGYQVDWVDRGSEAIEAIKSDPPDCIILDIRLPDKDGFCILREVQRERIDLPIIVLTVLSESEHRNQARQTGADAYLTKPFDFKELTSLVQAALDE